MRPFEIKLNDKRGIVVHCGPDDNLLVLWEDGGLGWVPAEDWKMKWVTLPKDTVYTSEFATAWASRMSK